MAFVSKYQTHDHRLLAVDRGVRHFQSFLSSQFTCALWIKYN